VHPAAKTLVDIARAQDAEIGDGTTTVTLLAAELLRLAKTFVEDGVHPQVIIRGYRRAGALAVARLHEIAVGVTAGDAPARRRLLEKCASTALNSKLIAQYQGFFAPMIVDAIEALDAGLDVSMIGVKKVPGGSVTESFLVKGVAFKRTFSYAGFEQQPKRFAAPKILSLNVELELKSEKENAEIRIDSPEAYQAIVDAEWTIIYDKLALCVATGANIVLSRLPIGDLATQYFADRGVFCAGRVHKDDLERASRATGARVQTTVYGITPDCLGSCEGFEEKQVGAERYNLFTGCPQATTATFVLRGGAEQFIDETERSIHDSIMIVKNCVRSMKVVAGGGATEMEISRLLKDTSRGIEGKQQLVMLAYARALELIPRQLADNAGFDATDILNRLRQKHASPSECVEAPRDALEPPHPFPACPNPPFPCPPPFPPQGRSLVGRGHGRGGHLRHHGVRRVGARVKQGELLHVRHGGCGHGAQRG
jgi:T-complex protein 1 subunit eta